MTSNQTKIKRIKILTLGDIDTGKSCIIKRYCEHRFVSRYMPTIGIDFGVTKVNIMTLDIKVNIFDSSGNQVFYGVRNEFYKDTQGILLVFDVCNKTSFDSLSKWLQELRKHLESEELMERIAVVVCGNKSDLSKRQVDEVDAKIWCEKRNFSYHETSSKADENITEAMMDLFTRVVAMVNNCYKPISQPTPHSYTEEELALVQRVRHATDNYMMLGLKRNAGKDEVLKAYKSLAILLHPDKNKAPGSEEAFKLIGQARGNLIT
ncbi:hypothetical protein LOD99_5870 [Oopsacas minuta]|uniref:J domain-containing protein n=1 Tax=Oopsacas minuta TaxID=111878 RepID=A0AAV7JNK7_9METZ|nr:hypothetical protein LOD99_5870 [Oopsacas minuta]